MEEKQPQQPQSAPANPTGPQVPPSARPQEASPRPAAAPAPQGAAAQPKPAASKPSAQTQPPAQQLPSLVGQEISGCEILNKTASGGMGSVYRARHKALNRIVCVKILSPALANDKKAVDLFLTEARAIAELDHPNIVNVYNVGKEKGYYFIVMSFIEGQTLSQMLRRQKEMPIGLVLDLFEGVLLGLQAAHEKGIIHRDIKPSNILIDPNMQPKVVDFGIAKKVDKEKGAAKSTELAGTAYFIAPEQAMGKNVDTRADLYAVGASLYYVLTGHFPYNGKNTMEIIQKHIKDPIPNPANLRPEIPVWLAQAVQKLMSKKPENRFRTAKEVVDFFRKMRADDQLRVKEGNAGLAINLTQEGALKVSKEEDFLPPIQPKKTPAAPVKLMEAEGLVPHSKATLPKMESTLSRQKVQVPEAAAQTPAQDMAAAEDAKPAPSEFPQAKAFAKHTLQEDVSKKKVFRKFLTALTLIPLFALLTVLTSYVFYALGSICSVFVNPDHSFLQNLYLPLLPASYAPNQLVFMGICIADLFVIAAVCRIKKFTPYLLTLVFLGLVSYIGGLFSGGASFMDLTGVSENLFSSAYFAGYLLFSVIMGWFVAKTYNRDIFQGILGTAFVIMAVALSYLAASTSLPPAFGKLPVQILLYGSMLFTMLAVYYLLLPAKRNAIVLPVIFMLIAVCGMWLFSVSGVSEKTIQSLDKLIARIPVEVLDPQGTNSTGLSTDELENTIPRTNMYKIFKSQTEFSNKTQQEIAKMIGPRITKLVPEETFTKQTFNLYKEFLSLYYHDGEKAMKWAVWCYAADIPWKHFNEDAPENHVYLWIMFLLILFNISACATGFLSKEDDYDRL